MSAARLLLAVGLVALVAWATGCGGGGDAGDDATSTGPASAAGETRLEIELWPAGRGEGAAVTATLACDPPAGELPDPAAACATLATDAARAALEPVAPGTACTELYGGPEQARIRGTLAGEAVDAELSRVNGCEIARWDALVELLPVAVQAEL